MSEKQKTAGYGEITDQIMKDNPGAKRSDVEAGVKAVFNAVKELCGEGIRVKIIGFGSFSKKTRAAGTFRNPKEGTHVSRGETNKLHFKPSPGVFA